MLLMDQKKHILHKTWISTTLCQKENQESDSEDEEV